MKVNQLRLGNVIKNCKTTPEKDEVVDIRILAEILDRPCDCYRPVEVTEQRLVKMGFSKQRKGNTMRYYLDEFYIITDGGLVPKYYITVNEEIQFMIDYVHQLQNLCFFLTGTEISY